MSGKGFLAIILGISLSVSIYSPAFAEEQVGKVFLQSKDTKKASKIILEESCKKHMKRGIMQKAYEKRIRSNE